MTRLKKMLREGGFRRTRKVILSLRIGERALRATLIRATRLILGDHPTWTDFVLLLLVLYALEGLLTSLVLAIKGPPAPLTVKMQQSKPIQGPR